MTYIFRSGIILKLLLSLVMLAWFTQAMALSRAEAVSILASPDYGVLVPDDFTKSISKDNNPVYHALRMRSKGVNATITGAPESVDEISMLLVFDTSNTSGLFSYMSHVATAIFPDWSGANDWVTGTLTRLNENGGGEDAYESTGKRVGVRVMPMGNKLGVSLSLTVK
jgi:hypothetical protein